MDTWVDVHFGQIDPRHTDDKKIKLVTQEFTNLVSEPCI